MVKFFKKINFVYIAILISLLIHFLTAYEITRIKTDLPTANLNLNNKRSVVKFSLADKKIDKKPKQKIVETKQKETVAPQQSNYLSNQNHKTKKQTRLKKHKNIKAAKLGKYGKNSNKISKKKANKLTKIKKKKPVYKGNLKISSNLQKNRKIYKSLLPDITGYGSLDAGYQPNLDDSLEVGDQIDINTTDYKYIGYFSSMRRAIELVWVYPGAASSRGIQGVVMMQFQIKKSGKAGRIKVLKSSGSHSLDQAIREAISDASPFNPLPANFNKDKILITGAFRYILQNSFSSN